MSNLNLQKLREWVWPWRWTFNNYIFANCAQYVTVQTFWKSVNILWIYGKGQSGTFFGTQCTNIRCNQWPNNIHKLQLSTCCHPVVVVVVDSGSGWPATKTLELVGDFVHLLAATFQHHLPMSFFPFSMLFTFQRHVPSYNSDNTAATVADVVIYKPSTTIITTTTSIPTITTTTVTTLNNKSPGI